MVCILCDSKTKTTNSRYMRRLHQTWRRHTCTRCFAVFTTRETVDMAQSFRIQTSDGPLEPFSRDELYLSIYDALSHRPRSTTDASDITNTIIAKLIYGNRLIIYRNEILETVLAVLKQFDKPAYVKYAANHQKS